MVRGGSANKFYDLTGPVPQNMHEIAADLGRGVPAAGPRARQHRERGEAGLRQRRGRGARRPAFVLLPLSSVCFCKSEA